VYKVADFDSTNILAVSPGSEQRLLTASFCDRLMKMGDDWYNLFVLLLRAPFPIVPHSFGKRGYRYM
jgi:hypothetical protein